MARRIDRRQKPAWQKARKPIPHPSKKKPRGKATSLNKKQ